MYQIISYSYLNVKPQRDEVKFGPNESESSGFLPIDELIQKELSIEAINQVRLAVRNQVEAISQDFIKTQYARPKSRECQVFRLLKDRLLVSSATKDIPNEVTSEEIQRECNERPENISRVLAQIKSKLESYNNTRYDDGLRLILVKERPFKDRRKIIAKLSVLTLLDKVLEQIND